MPLAIKVRTSDGQERDFFGTPEDGIATIGDLRQRLAAQGMDLLGVQPATTTTTATSRDVPFASPGDETIPQSSQTPLSLPQTVARRGLADARTFGKGVKAVAETGIPAAPPPVGGPFTAPKRASFLDTLGIMAPAKYLSPGMTVAGPVAEWATGSPGAGDVAEVATGLAPLVAKAGGTLLDFLRQLAPSGKEAATLGARAVANAGQAISNAGQLASQVPAGRTVQEIAGAQAGRLEARAQDTIEAAGRRLAQSSVGPRVEGLRKPPPPPVQLFDAGGREMALRPPLPDPLSAAEIPTKVRASQAVSAKQGAAALNYAGQVQRPLSERGPVAASKFLAKTPDVVNAMLAVATPDEAAAIKHALTVGMPLASLPFSAEALQSASTSSGLVGRFSRVALEALGGGAVGGVPGAIGVPLTMEFLDRALARPETARLVARMSRMAPSTPAYAAVASKLAQLVGQR